MRKPTGTRDSEIDPSRSCGLPDSPRYRTIVADPPWPGTWTAARVDGPDGYAFGSRITEHYPTMTLDAIKALPVGDLAAVEAHLYLWTTASFLRDAYDVAEAWGFEPMYPLVWCKPSKGRGLGGKFQSPSRGSWRRPA